MILHRYSYIFSKKFCDSSSAIGEIVDHAENVLLALMERVKELSVQGKSQREITEEVGMSVGIVNRHLKMAA